MSLNNLLDWSFCSGLSHSPPLGPPPSRGISSGTVLGTLPPVVATVARLAAGGSGGISSIKCFQGLGRGSWRPQTQWGQTLYLLEWA